jgi:hypothetical protein
MVQPLAFVKLSVLGSFCIFSKSWGLTVSDLPLLADEQEGWP